MEKQFLDHIQNARLVEPGQRVLLAVSGGLDSMAMLHLFHQAGFQVGVAHVNFQLRGAESDGDEALVKDTCLQLGIPCYVTRVDTAAYADTHKLSIQMAARELRYDWFKEIRQRENFDRLATAHHLNDQLETVLLNLTRGTELKSIPQRNGITIRPLLAFSRQQLEAYAVEKGIKWRDDSSNAGDDYPRNFIRHHVVPLLRQLNPSLERSFVRVAERLDNTRELAESQMEALEERYVSSKRGRITIDKRFATRVTHQASLLWELIKPYGFNYDQAISIVAAIDGQPGSIFHAATCMLVVDRTHLIITPHAGEVDAVIMTENDGAAIMEDRDLVKKRHDLTDPVPADPLVACLDAAQLEFPLVWRRWREGDFFYPLGMDHRKKVSDFLIDRKVSVADKATVTVLESGGKIAWVVGHRIDNRFKITQHTQRALRFSLVIQYFP